VRAGSVAQPYSTSGSGGRKFDGRGAHERGQRKGGEDEGGLETHALFGRTKGLNEKGHVHDGERGRRRGEDEYEVLLDVLDTEARVLE
jgi:hypothetical protein